MVRQNTFVKQTVADFLIAHKFTTPDTHSHICLCAYFAGNIVKLEQISHFKLSELYIHIHINFIILIHQMFFLNSRDKYTYMYISISMQLNLELNTGIAFTMNYFFVYKAVWEC